MMANPKICLFCKNCVLEFKKDKNNFIENLNSYR